MTGVQTCALPISQSGAFYWNDDWLIQKIRDIGFIPLNVQLEVGSLEPDVLISATERAYEALKGKVSSLNYVLTKGGHHYGYWAETIISALSRISSSSWQ